MCVRRLVLALVLGASACGSENGMITPPLPPPPGPTVTGSGPFVVSNLVMPVGATLLDAPRGGVEGRFFVSLLPGTLPNVSAVSFRVLRTNRVTLAGLYNGGLDPFPVAAMPSDTIVLTVGDGGSSLVFVVPARTPPVIIRTVPPKGTRDVALNARMHVVFSEPMASSVLSDGMVSLRIGGEEVARQVRFADAARTVVELVPNAELAPAAALQFVIDRDVRDLDGSTLGTTQTMEFTTVAVPPVPPPPPSPPPPPPPPPPPIADWTIAFVRDGQIHVATPTSQQQLTHDSPENVFNYEPAWSPDGARIAYVSSRQESQTIYLMNADGSNKVRLTEGTWDGSPVWTPDGRSIVYTTLRDGSQAIMRVGVDAAPSTAEVLLNLPGWDEDPTLSPDGQTLLFTTDWNAYDFLGDLYAITIGNPATMRPVLLVPFVNPLAYYLESTWSPDGQWIAFSECDAGWICSRGFGWLSIVRPDGTGRQFLADASGLASPSWSPVASHLAYSSWSCVGIAPCIKVIPATGGPSVEVFDNAMQPAWRPR